MTEQQDLAEQLAEQQRENAWLRQQLERQREINGELRRAVADLARTFQASLAEAYDAGEAGDIEQVRTITRANKANWQQYLQQIIAAAKQQPPSRSGS
jgi:hypothetical protein